MRDNALKKIVSLTLVAIMTLSLCSPGLVTSYATQDTDTTGSSEQSKDTEKETEKVTEETSKDPSDDIPLRWMMVQAEVHLRSRIRMQLRKKPKRAKPLRLN